MSDGIFLFLALVVAVGGMGCFALSNNAHWSQIFSTHVLTRGTTLRLRVTGGLLLAVSFLLCALADPVSMAALVWPMMLTVSAAIVAASLSIHARGARVRLAANQQRSGGGA